MVQNTFGRLKKELGNLNWLLFLIGMVFALGTLYLIQAPFYLLIAVLILPLLVPVPYMLLNREVSDHTTDNMK